MEKSWGSYRKVMEKLSGKYEEIILPTGETKSFGIASEFSLDFGFRELYV